MVKIASIITDFESAKDKLISTVQSAAKYGSIQILKSDVEKSNDTQSHQYSASNKYPNRISKSAGKVGQTKIPQKHFIDNK